MYRGGATEIFLGCLKVCDEKCNKIYDIENILLHTFQHIYSLQEI